MRTKLLALCLLSVSVLPWSRAVTPASAQVAQPARALTLAEALRIAEKESEQVGIARAGIDAAMTVMLRSATVAMTQMPGSRASTR